MLLLIWKCNGISTHQECAFSWVSLSGVKVFDGHMPILLRTVCTVRPLDSMHPEFRNNLSHFY
jgi:hypothetical protein